jgi:hypothetical protein
VLVLRPEITRPTRAGFFFREKDGASRVESSYHEFELEEQGGAGDSPAHRPSERPREVVDTGAARGSYARPLWMFALCLGVAAATLAAREYLTPRAPTQERFLLEVLDRSGQLQFQWCGRLPPREPE